MSGAKAGTTPQWYAGSCGRIGQRPQLDARSQPEIAALLLEDPSGSLARFVTVRGRTARQRDLQATVRLPDRRPDQCCDVTIGVDLTDQEITDIATGYAYLPRLPAHHRSPRVPKPGIVICGAPLRGIAPRSCHGSPDGWQPTVGGSVGSLYERPSFWPWRRANPQRHHPTDVQHRAR
jgi:hypothetical protein